jgi:hypothetical protein
MAAVPIKQKAMTAGEIILYRKWKQICVTQVPNTAKESSGVETAFQSCPDNICLGFLL